LSANKSPKGFKLFTETDLGYTIVPTNELGGHSDRRTERQKDSQMTETLTGRQTDRQTQKGRDRQTYQPTDRQAERGPLTD